MASGIDRQARVLSAGSPKDLTELEKACRLGHDACRVSTLICGLGNTPPSGRALFFAAGSGNTVVLNLILAAGAQVSSDPRFNPLNAACCTSKAMADQMVEILLRERPTCKPDSQTLVLACASKIESVAKRILSLKPLYTLDTIAASLTEGAAAGFSLIFLEKICAYVHTKPGGTPPEKPIDREIQMQFRRKIVLVPLIEGLIKNGWRPQSSTVDGLLTLLKGVSLDQGRLYALKVMIEQGAARVALEKAGEFLSQATFSLGDSEARRRVNQILLETLLSKK